MIPTLRLQRQWPSRATLRETQLSTATPVISATGLFTPADSISNEELVESFNAYVARFNADNAAAIEAGEVQPLAPSSVEFIEKDLALNPSDVAHYRTLAVFYGKLGKTDLAARALEKVVSLCPMPW